MSQQLVVRLGSVLSDEIYYAVADDRDFSILESGSLKGVEELSFLEDRVASGATILLPACRFFFKKLTYPKRFSSNMKSSIPFMIEDDVASEVDDLEVTVLGIHGKNVDIMAYDRSYLKQIKELLETYHIKVLRFIPDVFTLPYNNGQITVAGLGKDLIFRTSDTAGFCLEPSLAEIFFSSWEGVRSFLCWSNLPSSIEGVREEKYPENIMGEMARGALNSKLSLAGMESSQDRIFALSGATRPWLKVLIAIIVLMVTYLGSLVCSYIEVSNENQKLKTDLVNVFKSKFPQVTRVVNPVVQFRQLSNQKPVKGSIGSFIKSLYQVISGFSPKVKLLNFRYDSNHKVFTFRLSYQDVDDVDGLREALEDRSFEVAVGELRMDSKQNSVVLTVKEK